MDFEVCSKRH